MPRYLFIPFLLTAINTSIAGVDKFETLVVKNTEQTVKISGANSLRCWQEGRLIVEESQLNLDKSDKSQFTFAIKDTDQHHDEIHLVNLGNTFCMYKTK